MQDGKSGVQERKRSTNCENKDTKTEIFYPFPPTIKYGLKRRLFLTKIVSVFNLFILYII